MWRQCLINMVKWMVLMLGLFPSQCRTRCSCLRMQGVGRVERAVWVGCKPENSLVDPSSACVEGIDAFAGGRGWVERVGSQT